MIIPIFIYVREKSSEELREEMKRDARWNKMMREEEERERRRIAQEKRKKQEEKDRKERENNERWWNLERTNEWETRLLPEGWSIFGQRFFGVITERSDKDFPPED